MEYEQEVRLMVFDWLMLKNPVTVPKTEIVEITFGLKGDIKLINKVKVILLRYPNGGHDVELYQCVEKPGMYAIERNRI